MSFEQFMQRVDKVVGKVAQGFGADDFADAPWHDLYDDLGEDVEDADIIETLAQYDDIFARWAQLNEGN